jgi:hypothetical protein
MIRLKPQILIEIKCGDQLKIPLHFDGKIGEICLISDEVYCWLACMQLYIYIITNRSIDQPIVVGHL